MVVTEKKTHVDAAKYCASKEGTLCSDEKSAGVALAKEKGAENIWLGALDAKDADKEKAFVCEAQCHEGKLLNCYLGAYELQRMSLTF